MKIVTIILIFVLFSCNNYDHGTDEIFREMERSTNNKKILNDIKTFPSDSLYNLLPVFRAEFQEYLDQVDFERNLIENSPQLLDSEQEVIKLFAFQKYLNSDDIDVQKILTEIERVEHNIKWNLTESKELRRKAMSGIIEANIQRFREGDTIVIILPIRTDDSGHKSIFITSPFSKVRDYFVLDTLEVYGIIQRIFHHTDTSELAQFEESNLSDLAFELLDPTKN
ncbi:MAG TPA: hypothetical protein PKC58_16265 [Ignavibacteria bacterium]|nr:hypothetical protein [Ignavibacteria bacterium]